MGLSVGAAAWLVWPFGTAVAHEGSSDMFRHILTIFGAVLVSAAVAPPADAADDIATTAQQCSACHGRNGEPVNATTPIIWGQQANYLYRELRDYQSGARASPVMAPLVKSFSLEDLRKLADYFASQAWPARPVGAAVGTQPEEIAICETCHGQNFRGGARAPRLAGQSYGYLLGTMHSFAHNERTDNPNMPDFMEALTDGQREAIARYLSGL